MMPRVFFASNGIPRFLVKGRNPNMPMKNSRLSQFFHSVVEVASKRHKIEDNLRALPHKLCHSLI